MKRTKLAALLGGAMIALLGFMAVGCSKEPTPIAQPDPLMSGEDRIVINVPNTNAGAELAGATREPLKFLYASAGTEPQIAELLQAAWKKAGVEVELTPMPTSEKFHALEQHNFDIGLARWGGDYSNPYTFLGMYKTGSSFNYPGWSNAEYDRLIELGLTTQDLAEANKYYAAAEELLLNEAVLIPLVWPKVVGLVKPYIKGIHGNLREDSPPRDVRFDRNWLSSEMHADKKFLGIVSTPKDNTLRICLGPSVAKLAPQRQTEGWGLPFTEALYEGLANVHPVTGSYDPETGGPLPGVAESWSRSADGFTWTFKLRKDAVWVKAVFDGNGHVKREQDGSAVVQVVRPVTAQDFIWSWKDNCLDKKATCEYKEMFAQIFFADVQAPDPHTIVVTVTKPTGYFLEVMAFVTTAVTHKESAQQQGDKAFLPENIVTNGAYVLEYNGSTELRLVRNPKYWWWKTQPDVSDAPTTVVATLTGNPQSFEDTYRQGNAEWMGVSCAPTNELMAQVNAGEIQADDLYQVPSIRTVYLVVRPDPNDRRLGNRDFRMALAKAIDKVGMIRALDMVAVPATGYTPPGMNGYEFKANPQGYDLAAARDLHSNAFFKPPKKQ